MTSTLVTVIYKSEAVFVPNEASATRHLCWNQHVFSQFAGCAEHLAEQPVVFRQAGGV